MKKVWAVITITKAGNKMETQTGTKQAMKAFYRSEKGSDLLKAVYLLKTRKQWPKKAKGLRRVA
jgi:hypothetical protein